MIAGKHVSTDYTEGPSDHRKSCSSECWRTSSNFTQFPVSDHDLPSLTGRTLLRFDSLVQHNTSG